MQHTLVQKLRECMHWSARCLGLPPPSSDFLDQPLAIADVGNASSSFEKNRIGSQSRAHPETYHACSRAAAKLLHTQENSYIVSEFNHGDQRQKSRLTDQQLPRPMQ